MNNYKYITKNIRVSFLISTFFFILTACNIDIPTSTKSDFIDNLPNTLVSAKAKTFNLGLLGQTSEITPTLLDTAKPVVLNALQISSTDPAADKIINYGLQMYKLIYKTKDVNGKTVQASGNVILPIQKDSLTKSLPIILYCHGTIFEKTKAPSNFDISIAGITPTITGAVGGEFLASMGAIVVIPDYLGFGENKDDTHPFFIKSAEGTSNLDMLFATAHLAKNKGYNISRELFIYGYSQGGFTSIDTLHTIEKRNRKDEFIINTVYSGAGGYLPHTMLTTITEKTDYNAYGYILYVSKAYKEYNSINKEYSDFYIENVAKNIDTWIDGTKSFDVINDNVTRIAESPKTLSDIFKPDFKTNLMNVQTREENVIYKALKQNSFENNSFSSKIILYQSPTDEVIPESNTKAFYDQLQKTNKNVTKVELTGTHAEAGAQMLQAFVKDFISKTQ